MKTDLYTYSLDELLVAVKDNPDAVEPLFSNFVNNLVKEDPQNVIHIVEIINEACFKWEADYPLFKAFRTVHQVMLDYSSGYHERMIIPAKEAIAIFKEFNKKDYTGMALMLLGGAYRSLGKIDSSVQCLYNSIDLIDPQGKYITYLTYSNYQLAEIFNFIKDYDAAREAYLEAVKYAVSSNNNSGLFRSYNGLGNLYLSLKDYKQSKYYLDKCLVVSEMTNPQKSRAYCDLGIYHIETNELEKALDYLNESYNIRVKANLVDASSTSLAQIGRLYLKKEEIDKAIENLEKALDIMLDRNAKSKQVDCYYYLGIAYKKKGLWEKSSEAFLKYDVLQREFQSVTLQNIYKLKNQKIREQKEIIEKALIDIKSSISYAKRIQEAILPVDELINKHLSQSYILYQPKDIVAGDFYWFEIMEDTILFAVGDCTGHGVPGAMVSVICHNAMNRAVREFGLENPAHILDKVNELVQASLSKSEETEVKDGMDIALCSYNSINQQISFAGANNPLYLISSENNEQLTVYRSKKPVTQNGLELFEIKGDKQPIGKFSGSKPFESHTIQLSPGDELIMSSDGYPDQFGGDKNKKLMYKPFKSLLLSLQEQKMIDKKLKLETFFNGWKLSQDQTDDVCVIGIKFDF